MCYAADPRARHYFHKSGEQAQPTRPFLASISHSYKHYHQQKEVICTFIRFRCHDYSQPQSLNHKLQLWFETLFFWYVHKVARVFVFVWVVSIVLRLMDCSVLTNQLAPSDPGFRLPISLSVCPSQQPIPRLLPRVWRNTKVAMHVKNSGKI